MQSFVYTFCKGISRFMHSFSVIKDVGHERNVIDLSARDHGFWIIEGFQIGTVRY